MYCMALIDLPFWLDEAGEFELLLAPSKKVPGPKPKENTHPFSTMAFMSDNPAICLKPRLACIVECSETDCELLMIPVYRDLKTDRLHKNGSTAGLAATAMQ